MEYGFEIFRKLKEKLSEFVHPLLGQPTVQITGIQGGMVPNMTPDDAEFMLDIRTVPRFQQEKYFGMRSACPRHMNGIPMVC